MEEIYSTPKSKIETDTRKNISTWKKILCTFLILLPAGLYFLGHNIIPQFAETFSNFGRELPFETLLILRLHPYLAVLSLLSFIPLLVWWGSRVTYKYQSRLFLVSWIHAVIAVFGLFFLQWALYAPVIELGKTP